MANPFLMRIRRRGIAKSAMQRLTYPRPRFERWNRRRIIARTRQFIVPIYLFYRYNRFCRLNCESERGMTLEQLRIFVAVAEREHVTEAARALNLAQSAASHAIAALEARHNTKLFDRVGRRVVLTEAGRAFLAEARTILLQVERAELSLSEFGQLERGTLSVQPSQTIASYWLPRHLVAFHRTYPGIAVRLAIGNTAQVAAAIEAGLGGVGLVGGAVG